MLAMHSLLAAALLTLSAAAQGVPDSAMHARLALSPYEAPQQVGARPNAPLNQQLYEAKSRRTLPSDNLLVRPPSREQLHRQFPGLVARSQDEAGPVYYIPRALVDTGDGDNSQVSAKGAQVHFLTDDQKAELEHQKKVRKEQMKKDNAARINSKTAKGKTAKTSKTPSKAQKAVLDKLLPDLDSDEKTSEGQAKPGVAHVDDAMDSLTDKVKRASSSTSSRAGSSSSHSGKSTSPAAKFFKAKSDSSENGAVLRTPGWTTAMAAMLVCSATIVLF